MPTRTGLTGSTPWAIQDRIVCSWRRPMRLASVTDTQRSPGPASSVTCTSFLVGSSGTASLPSVTNHVQQIANFRDLVVISITKYQYSRPDDEIQETRPR